LSGICHAVFVSSGKTLELSLVESSVIWRITGDLVTQTGTRNRRGACLNAQ